jgi:hypothetical protein
VNGIHGYDWRSAQRRGGDLLLDAARIEWGLWMVLFVSWASFTLIAVSVPSEGESRGASALRGSFLLPTPAGDDAPANPPRAAVHGAVAAARTFE